MTTWADEARVLELTGVSVTAEQLAQAQGVLDIFTGVTIAAIDELSVRDLRLLGQALAYQTVWMASQVDTFTRTEVSTVNQDGVGFSPAHDTSLFLAFHARQCLKRLSWLRNGSLRVTPFSASHSRFNGFLRDVGVGNGEARWDWTPLHMRRWS